VEDGVKGRSLGAGLIDMENVRKNIMFTAEVF
jgi:hypothetical protein